MDITPQTDEEWTIHSMNIQGFFFETYCRKLIADSKQWKIVDTNYPVSFPVPTALSKGNESSLDIRAALSIENTRITLILECKKRNPNFVNWIFFPKLQDGLGSYRPVVKQITNIPRPTLQVGWSPEISLIESFMIGGPVTDEARETRGSYLTYKGRNDEKTKTVNDSITAAAYQVALANQSIVYEEGEISKALGDKNPLICDMPYKKQVFIPAILTNAKLFICRFDPGDVNPSTGEIPVNKATISSCPYLFYEYPLPRHLQVTPKDLASAAVSGALRMLTRMDILVINIDEFPNLLANLSSDIQLNR